MTLVNWQFSSATEQTIAAPVQVFLPDTMTNSELRWYVKKLEADNQRKDELNRQLALDNDRMRAAISMAAEVLSSFADNLV